MPGLEDLLARSQAAQGMVGGEEMGMPPEEGMAPEEAMPEPTMDLESALAGVEAALEGVEPAAAEEIRTHLNAIREIAAQGGGEAAPEAEAAPAEAMLAPEAGPDAPQETPIP